jgi:hypothetical protein
LPKDQNPGRNIFDYLLLDSLSWEGVYKSITACAQDHLTAGGHEQQIFFLVKLWHLHIFNLKKWKKKKKREIAGDTRVERRRSVLLLRNLRGSRIPNHDMIVVFVRGEQITLILVIPTSFFSLEMK